MYDNFNLKKYVELLNQKEPTKIDRRQLRFYSVGAETIDLNVFRAKFLKMQNQDDTTAQNLSINL